MINRSQTQRQWVLWGIPGVTLLTALVTFTGILPFLRPELVFIFFLVCPGLGFIGLLDLQQPLSELVLVIALSLAIDSVVALLLLYSGAWSAVTGFFALCGVSLLGFISLFIHKRKAVRK